MSVFMLSKREANEYKCPSLFLIHQINGCQPKMQNIELIKKDGKVKFKGLSGKIESYIKN